MILAEYIVLFVLVASMGAGLPALGDASLITAGTIAGEGKLNVGIVVAVSMAGYMLGSLAGYQIGIRGGRWLLERPGWLERSRLKLLAKGDRAFGSHTFAASLSLPTYVSGIFKVRLRVFLLGALVAGIGWIATYVGLSYFLGAEMAERIGNSGPKVLLGVIVVVALGLGIRAAYAAWSARRQDRATRLDRTGQ